MTASKKQVRGSRFNRNRYRHLPRVAFLAHALAPDYLSSLLIEAVLKRQSKTWWSGEGDPSSIRWFSFPVHPPEGSGGQSVLVDFYIIPVFALPDFWGAVRDGQAYRWVSKLAKAVIADAKRDDVELWLGWGALTKSATDHGAKFLAQEELPDFVYTTHGDAGTAAFVLETLLKANTRSGSRISILGANGAIGSVISRALPFINRRHRPSSIMLVGKSDKGGQTVKRDRLLRLQFEVQTNVIRSGAEIDVLIHQDNTKASIQHESDIVVVATTGMDLSPCHVPKGALVLDMTTPSACESHSDWQSRTVLTSGCGQLRGELLPHHFGRLVDQSLIDVGAGGEHVLWGCTIETIARAMFQVRGHLAGEDIPLSAVAQAHRLLRGLADPQSACSFGRYLSWEQVHSRLYSNPPPLPQHRDEGRGIALSP